jgi:hypothetical protein
MKEKSVEQKKTMSIDDIETFAIRLGNVDYLKPHCELLMQWANEARTGSKQIEEIQEFINGYRKRLRSIMGDLLIAFESLEGQDLADAIVALFPESKKRNESKVNPPNNFWVRQKKEKPAPKEKEPAFWE